MITFAISTSQLYKNIAIAKLVFTTFIEKKFVLKSIHLSTIKKKGKTLINWTSSKLHFGSLKDSVKKMKTKD